MNSQPGFTKAVADGRSAPAARGANAPRPLGREAIEMLAEIPLFAGLSRRHLGRIAKVATSKRFAPHTALVRIGRPADAFYVIIDGRARVELPNGGHVELHSGDFFGEMALIDGEPRSASVSSESDVYAMIIPRGKFLKVLEDEPKIALAIMVTLTRRLRDQQAAAAL